MALGLQESRQVNDISFAAKLVRLDTCMTYLRYELYIHLVNAGKGSIGWGKQIGDGVEGER